MNEDIVHVSLTTTFRLDQWDIDIPLERPLSNILPELLKRLNADGEVADYRVIWLEGKRELNLDETANGAGIQHGHTLTLELRESMKESARNKVFISYSREDRSHLERLRVHLKPLERAGLIDAWADDRIRVGDRWKDKIEMALLNARIAVLIVSADFMASDFIINNELPPLLTAAKNNGTQILPVIVGYCRFARDKNLNIFQAINDPAQPLSSFDQDERDRVYDQVAQAVEELVGSVA